MGEWNKTLSSTDTGSLFGEVLWPENPIDLLVDFIRVYPCPSVVELNRFERGLRYKDCKKSRKGGLAFRQTPATGMIEFFRRLLGLSKPYRLRWFWALCSDS